MDVLPDTSCLAVFRLSRAGRFCFKPVSRMGTVGVGRRQFNFGEEQSGQKDLTQGRKGRGENQSAVGAASL
jgi:hypothetical protein